MVKIPSSEIPDFLRAAASAQWSDEQSTCIYRVESDGAEIFIVPARLGEGPSELRGASYYPSASLPLLTSLRHELPLTAQGVIRAAHLSQHHQFHVQLGHEYVAAESSPSLSEVLHEALSKATADIRASTHKLVRRVESRHASRQPATPYVAKKQSSDLFANLEEIVEAIVEKKMAERLLSEANQAVQVAQVFEPRSTPGYEAAVSEGANVRAQIISGPDMLSSQELAMQLGVSRETVNQRRQKGALLALTHGSRLQRYPTWQLEPIISEALPDLLKILGQLDPWTQYLFITQGNPALNGRAPLDALRAGDRTGVLEVASEYADVMAPT